MLNADWLGAPRLRTLRTIGARGIKTFDMHQYVTLVHRPRYGMAN